MPIRDAVPDTNDPGVDKAVLFLVICAILFILACLAGVVPAGGGG